MVTELWKRLSVSEEYESVDPYLHRAVGTTKGNKYPSLYESPPAGRMMSASVILLDEQDVNLYGDGESSSQFPAAFDSTGIL